MSQTIVGNLAVELGISDDQLRAGLADAVVQAQAAGQKMQNAFNAATNPRFGAKGMGGFAQAFSRIVDDAQYGFRGIVNNLEQVGMSAGQAMGMSTGAAMGLGAVLTLLGVAINNATRELEYFADGRSDFEKLQTAASAFAGELNRVDAELKQLAEDTNALLKQDATSGIGAYLRRQIEELKNIQPEIDGMASFFAETVRKIGSIQEVDRSGLAGQIQMPGIDDAIEHINGLANAFSSMVSRVNEMARSFVIETDRMFRKDGGLEFNLEESLPWINSRLTEMFDDAKSLMSSLNKKAVDFVNETDRMFRQDGGLEFDMAKSWPWINGRLEEMAGDASGMNNVAVRFAGEFEQYLSDSFSMVRMPDVSGSIKGYMAALGDAIAAEFGPMSEYLEGRTAEIADDMKGLAHKAVSPLTWFFEFFGQSIEDQIELNKNAGRQAMRNQLDMLDMAPQARRNSEALKAGSELMDNDLNAKSIDSSKEMSAAFAIAIKGNAAGAYNDLQLQMMKAGVQGNQAEVDARIMMGNAAKGVISAFEELSRRLPQLQLDEKLKSIKEAQFEKDLEPIRKQMESINKERDSLIKRREGVQGRIDDMMNQRARSEVIGASAVFERNINAGGEDPQVKAIEKLGEELKEILNEIKGLG